MTSAPRPGGPGTELGKAKDDAVQAVMTITLRGESHRLNLGAITFGERAAVRKATGLPLEAFLPTDDLEANVFGLDSLQVLWWLARRGDDPLLTFRRVLDEWPADLGPDDIDLTLDTPEEGDPDPL